MFGIKPRVEQSPPQHEARGLLPRGWMPSDWAAPTAAGVPVTLETAMRSAAVAACVRVLKTTIAMLPVDTVRYVGKTRMPIESPPVVKKPSGRVSQRNWVAQNMDALLMAGNAYGQVTAIDRLAHPQQVETVHPDDVTWLHDLTGELRPYVKGKAADLFPVGNLIHIPASAFIRAGSSVAMSPVELAKQAIGAGLAAEAFGARFFGDSGHPTMVLKANVPGLTQEQAQAAKDSLINSTRGRREPAVLGGDWDLKQWQINPSDSQFIDLLRFEVEQACRFFGVPPTMVYAAVSGQNITYANITHNDLHYLKYSVAIWLADLEDAWSAMLTAPQVVKFNVDALLRMDAKTRWDIHVKRLKSKTTTINDVKALEDELPFEDDQYNQPGIPGLDVVEALDDDESAD